VAKRAKRKGNDPADGCACQSLTCRPSYRDLMALMAGRGVQVSHRTILRRAHHAPDAFVHYRTAPRASFV
jgi:transposase-like protein